MHEIRREKTFIDTTAELSQRRPRDAVWSRSRAERFRAAQFRTAQFRAARFSAAAAAAALKRSARNCATPPLTICSYYSPLHLIRKIIRFVLLSRQML